MTPQQEDFCKYIEIEKLPQCEAYRKAYPKSQKWTRATVDVKASNLANMDKILIRRKELRDELKEELKQEAKWTRKDAYDNLIWLLNAARTEAEGKGEISSANVSAIINATKELNAIFAVTEEKDGHGVLEDILSAVRGINND